MRSLFGEKPYDSVMTVPNIITSVGIILLVPYVWGFLTEHRWIMFVSLFLSSLSDLLDGGVARMLKQKTWLGEFVDPLRDRLLLLTVLLNIVYLNLDQLPFIILWGGMIVGYELLIVLCNLGFLPPQKRKVHLVGKLRQAAHLLLTGLVVLSFYFKDIIFGITNINFNFPPDLALPLMAACSLVALFFYVFSAKIIIKG